MVTRSMQDIIARGDQRTKSEILYSIKQAAKVTAKQNKIDYQTTDKPKSAS